MTSSRSEAGALERPPDAARAAVAPVAAAAARAPWPAPLARYRDLSALRYDYPLVLTAADGDEPPVRSLSDLVDTLLRRCAPPGADGEGMRQHVLRLEREIRVLAAEGATGTLAELWQRAQQRLLAGAGPVTRAVLASELEPARRALAADGAVIDCKAGACERLVTHLWQAAQAARARRFAERVGPLVLGLRELLDLDFRASARAREPARLKRAFGAAYESAFDFGALAAVMGAVPEGSPLPERRRWRVHAALTVLETQRFFPLPAAGVRAEPHPFAFASCRRALDACRGRMTEIAAVMKAIGIAELELDNRYREAVHDAAFERFDENALTAADLAWFPTYLVCLEESGDAVERAHILQALCAGLPMKILARQDDVLGDRTIAGGLLASGAGGSQLARMALGLGSVFVLQSASSNLYRLRRPLLRGLDAAGPALFCVYSGCGDNAAGLPPYLLAAAAMESRAYPAFTYDPAAGPDWAARFDVRGNPQPESPWPVHRFEYEDADHQRLTETLGFTFADFAACDRRHAGRLEPVAAARPGAGLFTVAEFLRQPAGTNAAAYTPMVGDDNVLRRFAVDAGLIEATRRCADAWRGLQELGRIHEARAPAVKPQAPAPAPAPAPVPAAAAPAAEPAPGSDEPYIETARCTTCEECININKRMFVYDDNKQAYLADLSAGTYRELVEAAEACQVSIIHPGKPRNPAEPDLDDLVRRAAAFR